jgi:hypothetical protein
MKMAFICIKNKQNVFIGGSKHLALLNLPISFTLIYAKFFRVYYCSLYFIGIFI